MNNHNGPRTPTDQRSRVAITALGLSVAMSACSSRSANALVVGAVVAALLANGLLTTIEDDTPGGWSNPDGLETPRYTVVVKEAGRWLLSIITAACAFVVAVVEPIQGPPGSFDLPRIVIAGGCALISAGLALRRRSLSTVGALAIVGSASAAAILGGLASSG